MNDPLGRASKTGVIGEMAHMYPHLATLCGAEYRRRLAPQQQLKTAHMASAAMEDARIRMGLRADFSTPIKHGKGFPILEHKWGELIMRHEASARLSESDYGLPGSSGDRAAHNLQPDAQR